MRRGRWALPEKNRDRRDNCRKLQEGTKKRRGRGGWGDGKAVEEKEQRQKEQRQKGQRQKEQRQKGQRQKEQRQKGQRQKEQRQKGQRQKEQR